MRWIDDYYALCVTQSTTISVCGCGEPNVQAYHSDHEEVLRYFDAYRRLWGLPKQMKTYKFRKPAFKLAQKRAKAENGDMLVLFNTRFNDMVVRKDVGQKPGPEQVLVAVCKMEEKKAVVTERNHGLDIPLSRKELREKRRKTGSLC